VTIQRFVWTLHAEDRLHERKLTKELVEKAIREGHPMRKTNEGEADWRIDASRFVAVYDHPHRDDIDAVCIVSVWSKHRKRRRSSSRYPE
jgi:hypothetical protein